MALWGTGADEFKPERWADREDGAAAMGIDHGFLTCLADLKECIGNSFAGVDFKCLLAATIGRF